jgi:hypothetical protein
MPHSDFPPTLDIDPSYRADSQARDMPRKGAAAAPLSRFARKSDETDEDRGNLGLQSPTGMVWPQTAKSGSFFPLPRGYKGPRAHKPARPRKSRAASTEVDCPCNGEPRSLRSNAY